MLHSLNEYTKDIKCKLLFYTVIDAMFGVQCLMCTLLQLSILIYYFLYTLPFNLSAQFLNCLFFLYMYYLPDVCIICDIIVECLVRYKDVGIRNTSTSFPVCRCFLLFFFIFLCFYFLWQPHRWCDGQSACPECGR